MQNRRKNISKFPHRKMAQKAGDWRYTGAMDKLPEQILNQFERVTDQLQSRQELLDRLSLGRPLRVKFGIDLGVFPVGVSDQ